MLDARLLCAAQMVSEGAFVADIGTDHAYLPVYLMETGRAVKAIAADIGEGPCASARRTVTAAKLENRIDVRVGDGLSVITSEEQEQLTDIVIAGMGGETIREILSAAPWCKRCRLVLQPMTKAELLRAFLFDNGFTIEEEHLIRDGRHLYTVMRAVFTDAARPAPLYDHIGALPFDEGLPYFEGQLAHLRRRIDGMSRAGDSEALTALKALERELAAYIERKGCVK